MLKRFALLSLLSLAACGTGEPGPAGAPGITLADKYSCGGTGLSGTTNLRFEHLVFIMSDGSAMATCAVDTPSYQLNAFNMYKPGTLGANTGLCAVIADLDGTPDFGYWEMTLNDAKTSSLVTFRNTGSTEDGHYYNLPCTKY